MKIDILDGVMAIIGQTRSTVVIEIRGLSCDLGDLSAFAKNETGAIIPGIRVHLTFFEYNLRGKLKNPQKLLKSLRGKVMRSILKAEAKFQQEMCDLDWAMDMAAMHQRGPAYPKD